MRHRFARPARSCLSFLAVLLLAALPAGGRTVMPAHAGQGSPAAGAAVPPFYTPPSPLPSGQPGAIVRSEPLSAALPAGVRGWKILYVSSDWATNTPIAVSGTVFASATGSPSAGLRPVIAWAHGAMGITPPCAPSLSDDGGASLIPGLAQFIQAGYVVVATDYPGLGTTGPNPFLVGISEARSLLDSVRAAINLPDANAGNRFLAYGHSQGGQAVLFTGQISHDYAPDLNLVGVAAAAPATELGPLMNNLAGTLPGLVLGSWAVDSWSALYPGASPSQILTPVFVPVSATIGGVCFISTPDTEQTESSLTRLASVLTLPFLAYDPTTVEPWASILQQNTPGATSIGVPLLIAQGTADMIVIPAVTQDFVNRLCTQGETVDYKTMAGVTHDEAGMASVPLVVPWALARFQGQPAPSTC